MLKLFTIHKIATCFFWGGAQVGWGGVGAVTKHMALQNRYFVSNRFLCVESINSCLTEYDVKLV